MDAVLGAISREIYRRVGKVFEMDQRGRRSPRQTSEVASSGVADGGRVEERRWECVKFQRIVSPINKTT